MNDAKTRSQPVVVACCFLLSLVALLFTACGAPVSGSVPVLPTRTSAPFHVRLTLTPKASQAADSPAGKPNQAALSPSADPLNGKRLFNTFQPAAGIACATCHRVDSEERLVGPGLLNVERRAATRVPGMSAVEYLHQSIVSPSTYVIGGYADLMPKNWGQVFSENQIDDLIAYLLTLKEE